MGRWWLTTHVVCALGVCRWPRTSLRQLQDAGRTYSSIRYPSRSTTQTRSPICRATTPPVAGNVPSPVTVMRCCRSALIFGLLRFGVERMHVKLVDAPYQCFGQESESAKMALILALLTTDFRSQQEVTSKLWRAGNNYVCYTTLSADDNGRAVFAPECCSQNADTGNADCKEVKPDTWITVLLWVIAAAKIIFLLFGPLALQSWIFTGSIRLQYYVVRLKQRMRKTILIKKAFMTDDSQWTDTSGRQKKIRHFRNFRRLVKTLPSDEIVPIVFQSLHIQVTGLDTQSSLK